MGTLRILCLVGCISLLQGLRFCGAWHDTERLPRHFPTLKQVVDWNMDRECLDVVEAAYAFARIEGLQQGHYDFIQCYVQRAFAYLGLERGVCSQADVNAVFMYNPELEVAWFDCHMNDFLSWSAFQKTSQERRPEDSLLNAKSNRSEGSGLDSVDQEAAAPEDEAAAVKAEEGGAGAEGASDHDAGADE